jgi:hypothetical protein
LVDTVFSNTRWLETLLEKPSQISIEQNMTKRKISYVQSSNNFRTPKLMKNNSSEFSSQHCVFEKW